MTKCIGCGVMLQYDKPLEKGFAVNGKKLCKRCFDLKNYNKDLDYKDIINNDELIELINNKKLFTFFLCDILNFNEDVVKLYNKINNDKVFVLTKADLLPKNISSETLVKNLEKNYNLNALVYSSKNYMLQKQIKTIFDNHPKSIICGITSSGKSTLINTLFNKDITTSSYKNTTQDFMEVNYENLTIFDTPGFDNYNVVINIKKPFKEKTLFLKKGYSLIIDDIILSTDENTNITIFYANNLDVITKKENIENYDNIKIESKSELVLTEAFIYFKNNCTIYINKPCKIRKTIVGSYE